MKVHGSILSPFVRKVLATLELKGLAYEQIDIIPMALPADFLKISPLGKIPAFEDGNLKICDSSVICEYIEEQYPEPPLLPKNPADRAKSRWIEEYADTKLVELCGPGIFFERKAKKWMQQETNEAIVEETINTKLPPVLDYLESQVPAQDFFFDSLGLADICLASPFINAQIADYRIDDNSWPKLAAFINRVCDHTVIAKLIEAENKVVAAFGG